MDPEQTGLRRCAGGSGSMLVVNALCWFYREVAQILHINKHKTTRTVLCLMVSFPWQLTVCFPAYSDIPHTGWMFPHSEDSNSYRPSSPDIVHGNYVQNCSLPSYIVKTCPVIQEEKTASIYRDSLLLTYILLCNFLYLSFRESLYFACLI
jgi:hypothetical protein